MLSYCDSIRKLCCEMFSLRIVNVDHYLSSPKAGLDLTYSQFRGSQIKSVPVFRIFGSTPSGNKTCLHVHGVFPYILVPYSGEGDAGRLMYQLASSLDKAINVSQNSSHSSRQHVLKIVQVSGRPFYGYHSQDHQFLKIFFYNPLVVKRACDLLQNGAVCGTKFQIHEGHVPFTLQFFIDYNLYGMSFINLKSVVYRQDGSPPGITSGDLQKESCCELEADAVAVDILNRLTIEGELAVNPGLAAIWREEKLRLKRDGLSESQRPTPPLAMSEALLRERLLDNLRYQGKCTTPLRDKIPYPAETQRTTGSDMLDASVLDTHSVSSLAPQPLSGADLAEETTVIDEELVLNLSQNSFLSSSLDQSLFVAMNHLAALNEASAAVERNVEDDSILGSQMLPEQDMFASDISDGELEALNYSLPPDIAHGHLSEDDDVVESDDSFGDKIPQLDGVGDFGGKKKSKQNKRRRKVLVENAATETYPMSENEDIMMNTGAIKDDDCWPEIAKQETLEEIFSEEEPYNSPINNFEDDMSVDVETMNVDMIGSLETVLRGDPSFVSGDLASEDVMFQPLDGEVLENETKNNQIAGHKKVVDQNRNVDVPSLNSSLDSTDMLAIDGEELLDTCQLDEILNEDLNKGLEIICENNPKPDVENCSPELLQEINKVCSRLETPEDIAKLEAMVEQLQTAITSDPQDGSVEKSNGIAADISEENTNIIDGGSEDTTDSTNELSEEVIYLRNEVLEEISIKTEHETKTTTDNTFDLSEEASVKMEYGTEDVQVNNVCHVGNDSATHAMKCDYEQMDCKTLINNISSEENQRQTDTSSSSSLLHGKVSQVDSVKDKANKIGTSPKKVNKHPSPKASKRKLRIKWTKGKISPPCNFPSFEMTRPEIKKYFSQLESIRNNVPLITELDEPQPIMWLPIRNELITDNKGLQSNVNGAVKGKNKNIKKLEVSKEKPTKGVSKPKIKSKNTAFKSILNKCNFSNKEKQKILSCRVQLKKLTREEIFSFVKKPVQVNSLAKIKNKSKKRKDGFECNEPLPSTVDPVKQMPTKGSIKVDHRKKEKLSKPQAIKSKSVNKSPKKALVNQDKTLTKTNSKDAVAQMSSRTNKTPMKEPCKVPDRMKKQIDVLNTACKVDDETSVNSSNLTKINFDRGKQNMKGFDPSGNILKIEDNEGGTGKDTVLQENQSSSFKLDKKCVIKLLPLPVDGKSGKNIVNSNLLESEPFSDATTLPDVQIRRLNVEIPLQRLTKDINCYPQVRVEKLVTTSNPKTEFKSPKSGIASGKSSSCVKDQLKLTKKLLDGCRKRPFRIFSLDGTVDSSSSDENVEDSSKSAKNPILYSTPNKRRKSKACRSPRNYLPLSIEIKKSPKAKPKNKISEEADGLSIIGGVSEGTSLHDQHSLNTTKQSTSTSLEEMEVSVAIQRLPEDTKTNLEKCGLTGESQPSTSRATQPHMKRLKVFVKRLSLDTPESGESLKHERVSQLRGRFYRSSSLPITSQ